MISRHLISTRFTFVSLDVQYLLVTAKRRFLGSIQSHSNVNDSYGPDLVVLG